MQKIQKIVKKIEFVDNTTNKELNTTKLYELYKLKRLLQKTTKVLARPLPNYLLNKIYVDIVKIMPITANRD